jgi:hypothetical protein
LVHFFNQGCVLHKVGAAEGTSFAQPAVCSLSIQMDEHIGARGQKGFKQENWSLA